MFDMKATSLMRLVLFLLVYFALTNLYISSTEEGINTSMDLTIVTAEEPVQTPIQPQESAEADQSILGRIRGGWEWIKSSILGGFSTLAGFVSSAASWLVSAGQRFFALLTFDIPFPESMMESETGRVLIGFIRGTVGVSISTMLIIVILNFVSIIASFIPFVGS